MSIILLNINIQNIFSMFCLYLQLLILDFKKRLIYVKFLFNPSKCVNIYPYYILHSSPKRFIRKLAPYN